MALSLITKRSGAQVSFDPVRITEAMAKAFADENVTISHSELESLTDAVVQTLELSLLEEDGSYSAPHVEQVQDIVEETLASAGYFSVAKSYILYRAKHADMRAQERTEALKHNTLTVLNRAGAPEAFEPSRIQTVIKGILGEVLSSEEIAQVINQVVLNVFDGMKTT